MEQNALKMLAKYRIIITCVFLIGFCTSIDIYLWRFDNNCLPIKQMRIWYNSTLLIFFLYTFIDEILSYKSYLHQQYNFICKITIFINIILVLFTHMDIINSLWQKWLMFNGAVIVAVITITSSAFRHGTFSNNDY